MTVRYWRSEAVDWAATARAERLHLQRVLGVHAFGSLPGHECYEVALANAGANLVRERRSAEMERAIREAL